MNISGLIKKTKVKFRQRKLDHSQAENIQRAKELQELKQERIRLEGKAHLEKARQQEINRIKTAKQQAPSKLMRLGKGLAKAMNEGKKQIKEHKPKKSVFEMGGGKNLF